MLLPSRPKAARLPDGDEEYTPDHVLKDAVHGLRGLSMAVCVLAGLFLVVMLSAGRLLTDPLWVGAGVVVFASAAATILASLRVERSAKARLTLTLSSLIPPAFIATLTIVHFATGGGFGLMPGIGLVLCAGYAFGLHRLRRPDVQAYFWTLESRKLDDGPPMLGGSEDTTEAEGVVLTGLEDGGEAGEADPEKDERRRHDATSSAGARRH